MNNLDYRVFYLQILLLFCWNINQSYNDLGTNLLTII